MTISMYSTPTGKALTQQELVKHSKKGIVYAAKMTYTMSQDVKYEFNSEDYPVNFTKDFTENISTGDQVYINYTLDFGTKFLFI